MDVLYTYMQWGCKLLLFSGPDEKKGTMTRQKTIFMSSMIYDISSSESAASALHDVEVLKLEERIQLGSNCCPAATSECLISVRVPFPGKSTLLFLSADGDYSPSMWSILSPERRTHLHLTPFRHLEPPQHPTKTTTHAIVTPLPPSITFDFFNRISLALSFIVMLPSTFLMLFSVLALVAAQGNPYFEPNSTGFKLQNGFERVFVQPFGKHAFRVRVSLMKDPTGTELSAFVDPLLAGPGNNTLDVSTSVPYQGSATIRNGDLVAELAGGTLAFYRVEPDGTRAALTAEYTDDKALPARYYVQEFRASSFSAQFAFTSDPQEMFFGVGQQACCKDNTVNKKGQVVDLVNFNSQVPIPVFMSNKVSLVSVRLAVSVRSAYPEVPRPTNCPTLAAVPAEFGRYKTRFVADEASVIDYWITTAPPNNYDALQEAYTSVTGRQPTPPDFILGYQQSKLRYYNQSQVVDVAQRFHDEGINMSMIVVDFFAWKYQGDWSFDLSLFPDPAGMAAQVKSLTGAEMMVSLWPSVEDKSVNYVALQLNGWLASTRDGTGITDSFAGVYTRLVDSTNPGAREFLWKRLNDSYFSKGIHNFWIDQADGGTLGEPWENNGQDNIRAIPYNRAFAQYFIGTQSGAGKMYPWLHQQAIDEGLHNLTSAPAGSSRCEYMSLTRSTFAGGQRFCSYLWSGDTISAFDTLLQQVTAGVSVAASGLSSWTLDIGGFSGLNVDSASMRVHGDRSCNIPPDSSLSNANNCPNEPWSYGDDNFPIIKKYIALRYQLVPYVKRLFQQLQETGLTVMRPLYYDFSASDPLVVSATAANDPLVVHQFLLGVLSLYLFSVKCVVIDRLGVQGATSKEVYLPQLRTDQLAQNFSWTHWWTGTDFGHGGEAINVSAPLDQIPVFYLGSMDDILSEHPTTNCQSPQASRIDFHTLTALAVRAMTRKYEALDRSQALDMRYQVFTNLFESIRTASTDCGLPSPDARICAAWQAVVNTKIGHHKDAKQLHQDTVAMPLSQTFHSSADSDKVEKSSFHELDGDVPSPPPSERNEPVTTASSQLTTNDASDSPLPPGLADLGVDGNGTTPAKDIYCVVCNSRFDPFDKSATYDCAVFTQSADQIVDTSRLLDVLPARDLARELVDHGILSTAHAKALAPMCRSIWGHLHDEGKIEIAKAFADEVRTQALDKFWQHWRLLYGDWRRVDTMPYKSLRLRDLGMILAQVLGFLFTKKMLSAEHLCLALEILLEGQRNRDRLEAMHAIITNANDKLCKQKIRGWILKLRNRITAHKAQNEPSLWDGDAYAQELVEEIDRTINAWSEHAATPLSSPNRSTASTPCPDDFSSESFSSKIEFASFEFVDDSSRSESPKPVHQSYAAATQARGSAPSNGCASQPSTSSKAKSPGSRKLAGWKRGRGRGQKFSSPRKK
ncbi:hypothetical protein EW146_g126 [Bondarzewia mesenterica]|uniref:Glycoside hydrolase family 31 TIM barrel domain-containing protein n=1 Tax=Bondarzewia mesenterica TaxID=1095465 RepID=A0A4S4M870_9AGAM|nr:hypothetical protein EW146_g126 [Bondarzewia mesenterica]